MRWGGLEQRREDRRLLGGPFTQTIPDRRLSRSETMCKGHTTQTSVDRCVPHNPGVKVLPTSELLE